MRKGFSLIEIIIVVAIASSIVFVVSSLSGNTNILNMLVSRELQSKADIDQILQIMTTEIRSATQSANGAYALVSAATSSFAFYTNGDNNGVVKKVRYFFASSTIYRGIVQPTGTPAIYPTSSETVAPIINDVSVPASPPLFVYYDDSYAGPNSPAMTSTVNVAPIRVVGIAFFSTVTPSSSTAPQYFSRLVDIRNLRDQ